jgi:hypothetical protein
VKPTLHYRGMKIKKTIMKLKIKTHDSGYRVLYFEFNQDTQEDRLYWFRDFSTLEDIELEFNLA